MFKYVHGECAISWGIYSAFNYFLKWNEGKAPLFTDKICTFNFNLLCSVVGFMCLRFCADL